MGRIKDALIDGPTDNFMSGMDDLLGTHAYEQVKIEEALRKNMAEERKRNGPLAQITKAILSMKTMEYQASMTAGLINDDGRAHDERRDMYNDRQNVMEQRNSMSTNEQIAEALEENNELMRQLVSAQGATLPKSRSKKPETQKSSVRRMMEAKAATLYDEIMGNDPNSQTKQYE